MQGLKWKVQCYKCGDNNFVKYWTKPKMGTNDSTHLVQSKIPISTQPLVQMPLYHWICGKISTNNHTKHNDYQINAKTTFQIPQRTQDSIFCKRHQRCLQIPQSTTTHEIKDSINIIEQCKYIHTHRFQWPWSSDESDLWLNENQITPRNHPNTYQQQKKWQTLGTTINGRKFPSYQ